jgi:hypothetical protein
LPKRVVYKGRKPGASGSLPGGQAAYEPLTTSGSIYSHLVSDGMGKRYRLGLGELTDSA